MKVTLIFGVGWGCNEKIIGRLWISLGKPAMFEPCLFHTESRK
jgi:hypothetical protein